MKDAVLRKLFELKTDELVCESARLRKEEVGHEQCHSDSANVACVKDSLHACKEVVRAEVWSEAATPKSWKQTRK
jgi:hypothetical protein